MPWVEEREQSVEPSATAHGRSGSTLGTFGSAAGFGIGLGTTFGTGLGPGAPVVPEMAPDGRRPSGLTAPPVFIPCLRAREQSAGGTHGGPGRDVSEPGLVVPAACVPVPNWHRWPDHTPPLLSHCTCFVETPASWEGAPLVAAADKQTGSKASSHADRRQAAMRSAMRWRVVMRDMSLPFM